MNILGFNDHGSITFKIVMDNDRAGLQVNVLNWGKVNFGMRQELAKVDRSRLFVGKGTFGNWDSESSWYACCC